MDSVTRYYETTHYKIHPIAELIPEMTDEEFSALKEDISGIGQIEPIILFEGMILDGRHRYRACCELGIEPIVSNKNLNGMSLIDAVAALNIHRRHLTVSQRAMVATRFLEYAEKRAKERQSSAGGDKKSHIAKSLKVNLPEPIERKQASDEVAEKFRVSGKTIRDAKVVTIDGTEQEKKDVISGKKAVSVVAKEVRERKKVVQYAEKPEFNRTNDAAIEWAKYTWNPVTGCDHGCKYCYARGIAERKMGAYKDIGFKPHFHEERLSAPKNTKLPEKEEDRFCFVSSMGDLFGEWVPDEWIIKVFVAIENTPEWTYLLLTKNPERYADLYKKHGESFFPKNVWLGASGTNQEQVDRAIKSFELLVDDINNEPIRCTYLSCEPLFEKIWFISEQEADLVGDPYLPDHQSFVDWVIVGAQSNPDLQPEWSWVKSIILQAEETGTALYFKPNLKVRPIEKPSQWT